eukprot:GEMP01013573.1.p1 GENE.GEMP01013573.1~~GEMP01013573.1.p1  ORF type:complete len:825 (+),score=170.16 GEMP01013573.1:178-2652(+)
MVSAAADGGHTDTKVDISDVLQAVGIGALSALSLVLGAIVGIWKLPSAVIRAALMAFGAGALIEALTIELFAHIVDLSLGAHRRRLSLSLEDFVGPDAYLRRLSEKSTASGDGALIYIAIGAAFGGASFFSVLNKILNDHGAFFRSAATVKTYLGKLRHQFSRHLIARIRMVPMFRDLPEKSIENMLNVMEKESFSKGEVIFEELDQNSSIFFLLMGKVQITVFDSATDGEVLDVFELGPNDVFGEMSLFVGHPIPATAIALLSSKVLRLPGDALHSFMQKEASLRNFVTMMASDRLLETQVFQCASPSTVARLVTHMKQVSFDAGDVLFHDVDSMCPISLVVLGSVEIKYENLLTAIFQENDLIGTDHLISGKPKLAICTALEKTTILTIDRLTFDKLLANDTALTNAVLKSRTIAPSPLASLNVSDKVGYHGMKNLPWRHNANGDAQTLVINESFLVHRLTRSHSTGEVPTAVDVGLAEAMHQRNKLRKSGKLSPHTESGSNDFPRSRSASLSLSVLSMSNIPLTPQTHSVQPSPPRSPKPLELLRDSVPHSPPVQSPTDGLRDVESVNTPSSASTQNPTVTPKIAHKGDRGLASTPAVDAAHVDFELSPRRDEPPRSKLSIPLDMLRHQKTVSPDLDVIREDDKVPSYNLGEKELLGMDEKHANSKHAATMIWLGIMLDAVPESVVIGILLNSGNTSSLIAFVIGVFLANFPEAMSSSGTLKLHGVKTIIILVMWSSILILTAIGAGVGALVFPPGSQNNPTSLRWQAGIEGMCAGAMLAMISNTALPEAFEQGGDVVGMSCVMGFLTALLSKAFFEQSDV